MEVKEEPQKRIGTEEATEEEPDGSDASIMNNCINIKVMYTNVDQFLNIRRINRVYCKR